MKTDVRCAKCKAEYSINGDYGLDLDWDEMVCDQCGQVAAHTFLRVTHRGKVLEP